MKYTLTILLTIILVFVCGCNAEHTESISTIPSISVINLENESIRIDNSFTCILSNNVTISQNETNTVYLMEGDNPIGGIQKYPMPSEEFPHLSDQSTDAIGWLSQMGLADAQNSNLDHIISTGLHGGWEVWFGSEESNVTHYLFPYESWVYDIWFDQTLTDNQIGYEFVSKVTFESSD